MWTPTFLYHLTVFLKEEEYESIWSDQSIPDM